MKKTLVTMISTAVITLSMCIPAFAGQWVQDALGRWWQNDDGSWPANGWQWIDDNYDGMAECYYFDVNGYLAVNTITPDGYTVTANGAWVENGIIQMQQTGGAASAAQTGVQADANIPDITGTYVGTYNGKQIQAVFEQINGTIYAEIDFFLKDTMPPYLGNGLFEDAYNSFQFTGNSFLFKDFFLNESVYFTKQ